MKYGWQMYASRLGTQCAQKLMQFIRQVLYDHRQNGLWVVQGVEFRLDNSSEMLVDSAPEFYQPYPSVFRFLHVENPRMSGRAVSQ